MKPASESTQTSAGYSWYVVGVLVIAYTFAYVDRAILTLMVKPIRESLQISDLQLSLLHGLAFALFYTTLGIPIARLADRGNRTRIIMTGIAVWSAMTALCGFAQNFWHLFLARVGVGIGEAALSPSAYSILGDYFKGSALARALSVYTGAIYMGSGLALMIGGAVIAAVPAIDLPWIGRMEPWQVVFLWVGAPGLLVALLMMTVREPVRTGLAPDAVAGKVMSLSEVATYIKERRGAYGFLFAGYAFHGLIWNGAIGWIPTFFIRHHGMTQTQIGLRFGALVLVFGTLGVISGGVLSGLLKSRGRPDSNPLVGVVSAVLILPAGVLATQVGDSTASLTLLAFFLFLGSMPYGAAAAAFQEITPNQMRAQVIALYFLFLNLFGIGLGPTVVAFVTDKIFQADGAVGDSIGWMIAVVAPVSALLLWLSLKPYRQTLARAAG